jgi:hypothetical protein
MFILQAPAISPTTLKALPKVEKAKESNEAETTTASTSEPIADSFKSSNLSTKLDKYDLDKQNLTAANKMVKKELKYGKIGMISGGAILSAGVIGTVIKALATGQALSTAFGSLSAFGALAASTPLVPALLLIGSLILIGGFMLHSAGVIQSGKAVGGKKEIPSSPKENIFPLEKGTTPKKGFFERLKRVPFPFNKIFETPNNNIYNSEINIPKSEKMDLVA